ncbi:hypothetical protein HDU96_001496 [Phlyctochytrium bullatum]|nr:hypothetical protein HDU96_001496 [Phlyctochytrium bullatum]
MASGDPRPGGGPGNDPPLPPPTDLPLAFDLTQPPFLNLTFPVVHHPTPPAFLAFPNLGFQQPSAQPFLDIPPLPILDVDPFDPYPKHTTTPTTGIYLVSTPLAPTPFTDVPQPLPPFHAAPAEGRLLHDPFPASPSPLLAALSIHPPPPPLGYHPPSSLHTTFPRPTPPAAAFPPLFAQPSGIPETFVGVLEGPAPPVMQQAVEAVSVPATVVDHLRPVDREATVEPVSFPPPPPVPPKQPSRKRKASGSSTTAAVPPTPAATPPMGPKRRATATATATAAVASSASSAPVASSSTTASSHAPTALDAPALDPLHPSFPCASCPKTFPTRAKLRDHRRCHNRARDHVCGVTGCGKRFLRAQDLERHAATHLKPDERGFACGNGCGRRFGRGDAAKRHARLSCRWRGRGGGGRGGGKAGRGEGVAKEDLEGVKEEEEEEEEGEEEEGEEEAEGWDLEDAAGEDWEE